LTGSIECYRLATTLAAWSTSLSGSHSGSRTHCPRAYGYETIGRRAEPKIEQLEATTSKPGTHVACGLILLTKSLLSVAITSRLLHFGYLPNGVLLKPLIVGFLEEGGSTALALCFKKRRDALFKPLTLSSGCPLSSCHSDEPKSSS